MKEFTSYDLAILIYENYIDIDSLKDSLEQGNRGIRQIIRDKARIVKLIKETEPHRNMGLLDEEKELEKFNKIKEEIEEIED